jgi:hypothetical protein
VSSRFPLQNENADYSLVTPTKLSVPRVESMFKIAMAIAEDGRKCRTPVFIRETYPVTPIGKLRTNDPVGVIALFGVECDRRALMQAGDRSN